MRPTSISSLLVAALLALAVGLVACGGSDGSEGADERPDAQRGGKLTVLATDDVDYIDPGKAYYQFTYMVTAATHRTLYAYKPEDSVRATPDLAESEPEVSEDGRTVTIRLRDGVRFSPPVDREVTSADVKYAIERGFTANVANGYAAAYMGDIVGAPDEPGEYRELEGIETPDDRTIVFRLDRPTAGPLIGALSLPLSAPVPKEYAREHDRENPSTYGENQVFTGPYAIRADSEGRLTGYRPGQRIELVRNPSWDKEASGDFREAYLDEIDIRQGNDDTTAASRRILRGEGMVNGDFPPPPEILKQASQGEQSDQLELVPSGGLRYVAMNTKIEPFDDLNVRRAVLAAFDREAMRLTRGGEVIGDIPTHFIPPDVPGFEEAGGMEGPGVDFLRNPRGDMELAAEYMRKAGYESGRYEGDEELLMVGTREGVAQRSAEVARAQFEKLGFNLNFRLVSGDAMYTRFCTVPEAEVAICPNVAWMKDFNDGQTILGPTFDGDNILPENNSNWPQLDVEEINNRMDEAAELDDPDERARAWGEIDKMVTEQAPAIPWLWDKQPGIRSADVNGVVSRFNAFWDLSFTSIRR
jgi:peptide/nickel transport system substrate-binding protein